MRAEAADALFARRALAAAPRRGGREDRAAVSETLSRAFACDPQLDWLLQDGARRPAARRRFFDMILDVVLAGAGEIVMAEDASCAALWAGPGQAAKDLPLLTELAILPRLLGATGWARFLRAGRVRRAMDAHHPKTPPHWYLMFIGVDPQYQGQGLGGALLGATLAGIDADRLPAYLEASTPDNRRLYERFGFRLTQEFRAASDAPPMWAMWRDPHGTLPG